MKRYLSLFLSLVLLISFSGCGLKASDYTEEEHVQRVTERVEKKYKDSDLWNGRRYDDYTVYPLYSEDEVLTHFLVEFEPYGFVIVLLLKEESISPSCILSVSMYKQINMYIKGTWSPYWIVEENRQREYFLDEDGQVLTYNKSPYYVAGKMNERKYLLNPDSGDNICAVKEGDVFVNLMNGTTIDVRRGGWEDMQAGLGNFVHDYNKDSFLFR